MTCDTKEAFLKAGLDRVINQYSESPKLLHMIKSHLEQLWVARNAICQIPDYFDLDTAVGDQLTIVGKWMGFPRCHCVCSVQPVFGFACETGEVFGRQILGFCEEALWIDCTSDGVSEICITDDETYRKFLKVRAYQIEKQYDLASLVEALRILFGEQAEIMDSGYGEVVVAPLRELSPFEKSFFRFILVFSRLPRVYLPGGILAPLKFSGSVKAGEGSVKNGSLLGLPCRPKTALHWSQKTERLL